VFGSCPKLTASPYNILINHINQTNKNSNNSFEIYNIVTSAAQSRKTKAQKPKAIPIKSVRKSKGVSVIDELIP
jgi:hypothetical protein